MENFDDELKTFSQSLKKLISFKSSQSDNFKYIVGVDVGATNTRLCITHFLPPKDAPSEEKWYEAKIKFGCTSTKNLLEKFNKIQNITKTLLKQPSSGSAIAVAGPVQTDRKSVIITNYDPKSNTLLASDLPKDLFKNCVFLNDLESCCYGIIGIFSTEEKTKEIGSKIFKQVFCSDTCSEEDRKGFKVENLQHLNFAVLQNGTGLGTGLILAGKKVVALEGGHIVVPTIASGFSEKHERELLRFLSKKIYDSKFNIEFEDIVSGRGLLDCYEFYYTEKYGKKPEKFPGPGEIGESALKGDEVSENALLMYLRYLMKCAKSISILSICKGIFLVGNNQVHDDKFFEKHKSKLEKEFYDHVKKDWLPKKHNIFKQCYMHNLNLEGTYYYVRHELPTLTSKY